VSRSLEDLERDSFLAEAEALAHLMQHPSWPRYEALLGQMRQGALELIATTLSARKIARYQGAAAILQELIERPHQIVAAGQQIRESEKAARENVRTALDLADRVTLADDL
jgi:hypothetical protein